MEYILKCLSSMATWSFLWMGYVHIYGISLELYKDGKKQGSIWERIRGIKKSVVFWTVCIFLYILLNPLLEDDRVFFLYVVFLHAFFYCAATEKKVRTSLWIWIVLFTISVPLVIIDAITEVVGATYLYDNTLYDFFTDFVILVLMIMVCFIDKKYHFARRVQYKEKYLLVIISIFISFVGIIVFSEELQLEIGGSKVLALVVYLALSAFALIMVIRVIAVGTTADYYEELSAMHEKNAREALAFYESYKEAQLETRKLRHDMRNHFFCIQMLAKEEKYAEMEEYLENINEAVSGISMKFQTGNDIVDAILNVKQDIAKKKDIQILLEGNVPIMPFVDAMDWCKIFSNAVDNGIEALEQCEKAKRILQIQLKSNGHFFVIQIKNPCAGKVQISEKGVVTSKKESYQHGFGLKNIETALKKYGGELKLTCMDEGEGYVFIADMIMPERQNKVG